MCHICRRKIEEYGRDDRQEVVSKTIDGCAPLFLACRFTTHYFFIVFSFWRIGVHGSGVRPSMGLAMDQIALKKPNSKSRLFVKIEQ
jgi:hypothetical protein